MINNGMAKLATEKTGTVLGDIKARKYDNSSIVATIELIK